MSSYYPESYLSTTTNEQYKLNTTGPGTGATYSDSKDYCKDYMQYGRFESPAAHSTSTPPSSRYYDSDLRRQYYLGTSQQTTHTQRNGYTPVFPGNVNSTPTTNGENLEQFAAGYHHHHQHPHSQHHQSTTPPEFRETSSTTTSLTSQEPLDDGTKQPVLYSWMKSHFGRF